MSNTSLHFASTAPSQHSVAPTLQTGQYITHLPETQGGSTAGKTVGSNTLYVPQVPSKPCSCSKTASQQSTTCHSSLGWHHPQVAAQAAPHPVATCQGGQPAAPKHAPHLLPSGGMPSGPGTPASHAPARTDVQQMGAADSSINSRGSSLGSLAPDDIYSAACSSPSSTSCSPCLPHIRQTCSEACTKIHQCTVKGDTCGGDAGVSWEAGLR